MVSQWVKQMYHDAIPWNMDTFLQTEWLKDKQDYILG